MGKVLILGSEGMLGKAVVGTFQANGGCVYRSDIRLEEKGVLYIDVREGDEVLEACAKIRPDIIINLAALTDLEECEHNALNAFRTNQMGSLNCAAAANLYNALYVYVSTAGIFDGKKNTYVDDDTPNPLSIYGRAKHYGELEATHARRYYVFRAGGMVGGESRDKKFVKKILQQLKSGEKKIYAVYDKLGTPTYTIDFAKNMFDIATKELLKHNVYNMVCEGQGSRYDVARHIVDQLGLDVEVIACNSSRFENYYAPRPYSEQLINRRLNYCGQNNMRHWKECLNEYIPRLGNSI